MKLLGWKKYPQDFSQNSYESDFSMKVLLLSPPPSYSAHPWENVIIVLFGELSCDIIS